MRSWGSGICRLRMYTEVIACSTMAGGCLPASSHVPACTPRLYISDCGRMAGGGVTLDSCTNATLALNQNVFSKLFVSCGGGSVPDADCCSQVDSGFQGDDDRKLIAVLPSGRWQPVPFRAEDRGAQAATAHAVFGALN